MRATLADPFYHDHEFEWTRLANVGLQLMGWQFLIQSLWPDYTRGESFTCRYTTRLLFLQKYKLLHGSKCYMFLNGKKYGFPRSAVQTPQHS